MAYYWFRAMSIVNEDAPTNGVTFTKIVKIDVLSLLLLESQITWF
jgi:hypothetical protein